ncbi:lipopolysaccharide kinase InaA family protein [Stutzerimonas azotifigens]|uniref:lipopolysaccharide kinase InaA family protein n=1 Tax=Stutzerimonas azotifigens TaxID=291995 RepID=UPI00042444C5|nr:lipopolysaccharide kinase InaA family protein [Stutzerimonas azotifigens]
MKLGELAAAGRHPAVPLDVELPDGGSLQVEQWLRILPGQRYVARARHAGRAVLAKLYVGAKARRHAAREREGVRLLREAEVPTPALLAEGDGEAGAWLLFEFIEQAEGLGTAWTRVEHQAPLSPAQERVLGRALAAIAQMHAKGLWQGDLHLDNLLWDGCQLWLIDGAAIEAEQVGQLLGAERAEENLALCFAQLPGRFDDAVEPLLRHYRAADASSEISPVRLRQRIVAARRKRLEHYLKKLGRDCTAFHVRRDPGGLEAVQRDQAQRLAALLADPDAAIARGVSLKDGGSATVARVAIDDGWVVIKRYNIKGVAHWLKRFWRPTRAWHSWVEGHRLNFLGIASPRPLAVIERRWLGLRGRSYLITDYAPGEDIITRFGPYLDERPPEPEVEALRQLFDDLQRERFVHGDLKGTNLLWQAGRWALIDLDAAGVCPGSRFAEAHARDRARLLRNWPADSALHRLLDSRLPRLER